MGSMLSNYLSGPELGHKKKPEKMNKSRNLRYLPIMLFQLILMAMFFAFVTYLEEFSLTMSRRRFEEVHVMIFVGFGFLMTFLRKYAYSGLGFNWFLAALAIQWAFLCQNYFFTDDLKINIYKENFLKTDIMAASVLITFGALLGLASDLQLLFISVVEVAVACANSYIVREKFLAVDVGGSIAIHAFGAYFGLGASWALKPRHKKTSTVDLGESSCVSEVTALIGSLLLWVYWPCFNSVLTRSDSEYERAVINTYLSLASATVTTFVMSSLVSHDHGKLDMEYIQNSTLAGGVAVGSVCNMHIKAGGAIAVGISAGVLSVLGYRYLTPRLTKLGIRDTCGVHNLHGMPGIYSGLLSVVFAAVATEKVYGKNLFDVFPAMGGKDRVGRTATKQALFQLLATLVTIVISIVAGGVTGLLSKLPCFAPLEDEELYEDDVNWVLPE